mmetsp:Transcript_4076/g.5323  ORF Transcript_4076/g.5323 Transcript_4076/m.5323 type:complete len:572 (+) Transcript_4076:101-1816(+)
MMDYNSVGTNFVGGLGLRLSTAQKLEKFDELEKIMKKDCKDNLPLIFLHPDEERNEYFDTEVEALSHRDFKTRILITSLSCNNNSVWVRTHHTDNAKVTSNFTYIRDYFKASHITENYIAAKATLTAELSKWFDFSSDKYYTYATTLASALSDEATNTTYESHKAFVSSTHPDTIKLARRKLILLMDILFTKVYLKKFLYDSNNCNIYRLAHCATKHNNNKYPLVVVTFSFLLQLALTAFVVLEIFNPDKWDDTDSRSNYRIGSFYVLAILGGIYSIMVASKEYMIAKDVYQFYGKIGVLQMIDAIINLFLPVILLIAGAWVIIFETDFIQAVLNTAAFLFIPEIDDRLPQLLGYDDENLIENYLIAESKAGFNDLLKLTKKPENIHHKFDYCGPDSPLGVNFCDYYITNTPEQGASPKNGTLYQPYIVIPDEIRGHEIDPSNYVTSDCLLRRVTWRYTQFNPKTTEPRVGYLKLTKLDGNDVEISGKGALAQMDLGEEYTLEGVFIITTFVMSSGILKLRLCGSDTPENFVKAFDYYSLWELTYDASKMLKNYKEPKKGTKAMSRRVLPG